MTDCKVIKILKQMREEERKLIAADFDTETTIGFTHGDKVEALNIAIFELENRDKFYIAKDAIEEKIKELQNYNNNLNDEMVICTNIMKTQVLDELLGDE